MPGDHFYTTSRVERDNAFAFLGYVEEGRACFVFDAPASGTTPLYRLVQVAISGNVNVTQSPWAVLLGKFKGDPSEPPTPSGVVPLRTVCEWFFTQANNTLIAVKFFSEMSHPEARAHRVPGFGVV